MDEVDLDLSFLSIEERQTILAVLQRDEELRNAEEARKKELKNEINQLRQKSAIRVGEEQKSRQCVRCHTELGLIFNKGELCPKCKHHICTECKVTVKNSTAYQWLCTLCFKQRQLPAVAGDWFYQQLDEKYKHELTSSSYGTAVVRSSMRRLQGKSAANAADSNQDKLGQSVERSRNNPFTGGKENGNNELFYQPASHGGPESSVSELVGKDNKMSGSGAQQLTVRRVISRKDSTSSEEGASSEDENKDERPDGNTKHSKSKAYDVAVLPSRMFQDEKIRRYSAQSEPGLRSSHMNSSHSCLRTTQSLDPSDLLHPSLRPRSKSAVETIMDEAEDGTVESLTNIKFRRCSVSSVDFAAKKSDESGDPMSDKILPTKGLGSGGLLDHVGENVHVSVTKTNQPQSIVTLPGPPKPPRMRTVHSDPAMQSNTLGSDLVDNATSKPPMSPSTRRKLSLTPELQRKSRGQLIGRRELDISEKFLKSFSESSSEESDSDEDVDLKKWVETSTSTTQIEMPPISRKNLDLRLSIIEEDLSEDLSTLQRKKNGAMNKLKLILKPDNGEKDIGLRTESGTPVTPDKYNDNWQQFGSTTSAGNLGSWSSEPSSTEISYPTSATKANEEGNDIPDMDANASFAEISIISPKPVFRKGHRRVAIKKKAISSSPFSTETSSNDTHAPAQSPSTNQFFQFPPSDISSSSFLNGSLPIIDDLSSGDGSDAAGGGDSAICTLDSAKCTPAQLLSCDEPANPPLSLFIVTNNTNNKSPTEIRERLVTGSNSPPELSHVKASRGSGERVNRHSPDGCSPKSSRKGSHCSNASSGGGVEGVSGGRQLIPTLSVTDEQEHTKPLRLAKEGCVDDEDGVCHSDGEGEEDGFDEEDIDDLFEQAKKEKSKSKLSSHLNISMESISSIFSDAGTDYNKHEISGDMEFTLKYDKTTGVLTVTVHQCKELAAVHKKKKTSDPYVKVYLLAADNHRVNKRKTKVKKSTVNPHYEETFRYTINEADLLTKSLQLSVWSFHRIGHGDFLGEINIPFETYNFSSDSQKQWYPLSNKLVVNKAASRRNSITSITSTAELRVAIQYVPMISDPSDEGAKANKQTGGELNVKIISAQYLPVKKSGIYDPYVKCLLLPDKLKCKTAVVKNNLNPVWDEAFVFHKVQMDELTEIALEFAVWDHDRFSSNELLGSVKLNLGKGTSFGKKCDWMEASEQEVMVWEQMINNPTEWVEQSLPLHNVAANQKSSKSPRKSTSSS